MRPYPNTATVSVRTTKAIRRLRKTPRACEVVDVKPTVTLDKSVDPASMDEPGGTFTYT